MLSCEIKWLEIQNNERTKRIPIKRQNACMAIHSFQPEEVSILGSPYITDWVTLPALKLGEQSEIQCSKIR
jgi:hypothetical protein